MHTIEQAKQLWCPMARVGVPPISGGPAGINDPTTDFSVLCIADRCSMWRWRGEASKEWIQPTKPPWSFQPPPIVRSDVGFCGLAGVPTV